MSSEGYGATRGQAEPGFTFDLNHSRRLLRIGFHGQWSVLTVATYRLARSCAFRGAAAAGIEHGQLLLLVERWDQPVQSQEVVAAIGELVADNGKHARRTAVIVTSVLHARQIRRTAPTPAMEVFHTEEAALAWLLGT